MAQFLARFKERPEVRTIQSRFEFTPVATVETVRADFAVARAWALAPDPIRQLQGKVLPRRLHPESDHTLWAFELEEDAILFACKWGGQVTGSLDASVWRNRFLTNLSSIRRGGVISSTHSSQS